MTHDSHEELKPGESGQSQFLGYFALGMLVLMAVFTIAVLGSAARMGFS